MLTSNTILQGRYFIIRQLAQGGMGAVYEAIDQRLKKTVALKETFFTEERLRKQFEREAQLLARLEHPALPGVSDHFTENDGQFLVMQFIPGDDLCTMLQRRGCAFLPAQVISWGDQLLDVLEYMHSQEPPVIHRDIKPQNLKLNARGRIILLDFGLAKGFAGQVSRMMPPDSVFGYTPNYGPLEQIKGDGSDPRSDLYALAATMYHLMTNEPPPDVLTRLAAVSDEQPDTLLPAKDINPQINDCLSALLQKAMAISRNRRPASAAEMRDALREAGQSLIITDDDETNAVHVPPPTVLSPPSDQVALGAKQFHVLTPTMTTPFEPQAPPASPLTVTSSDFLRVPSPSSVPPPSSTPLNPSGKKLRRLAWLAGGIIALLIVSIVSVIAISRWVKRRNREDSVATQKQQAEQHAKRGRESYYRGKWADAAEEFRKGAQLEPEAAQWRVQLGDALLSLGKRTTADAEYKEGERLAKQALQRKPNDASAHNALGHVLFGQPFAVPARAEASYREAVRLEPNNAFFHTDLALALSNRFKNSEAEAESREAIRLEPNIAINYADLGYVLARQNKYSEAETAYRTAQRLDPAYPVYRESLADIFSEQKKTAEADVEYKEAERLYREQTRQEPNSAIYHLSLGNFLARRKKYDEAEAEVREAIRLEPNESFYHSDLASLYEFYQNKYAEANAEYREAVRLQPNQAYWYNDLGYHYLRGKKYVEAEAALKEAIRLEPLGNYHDSLGDVFIAQKKYEEAENEYGQAIRLDPDVAVLHSNFAFALEQRKKYAESETQYREAVRLEPNIATFRSALANFFYRRKRYAEAEAEYREAIKLEPNNGYYHNSLANILTWLKRNEEAKAEYREAIRLEPDNKTYNEQLRRMGK